MALIDYLPPIPPRPPKGPEDMDRYRSGLEQYQRERLEYERDRAEEQLRLREKWMRTVLAVLLVGHAILLGWMVRSFAESYLHPRSQIVIGK